MGTDCAPVSPNLVLHAYEHSCGSELPRRERDKWDWIWGIWRYIDDGIVMHSYDDDPTALQKGTYFTYLTWD